MPRIMPISDKHCSDIKNHSDIYIMFFEFFSECPELKKIRLDISVKAKESDHMSILNIGSGLGDAVRLFAEYTKKKQ